MLVPISAMNTCPTIAFYYFGKGRYGIGALHQAEQASIEPTPYCDKLRKLFRLPGLQECGSNGMFVA
jgi:hypothetical protein